MKFKKVHSSKCLEVFSPDFSEELDLPLYGSKVSAGFPSPADDYLDVKIDLNKHLVQHPSATFYVRVKGNSMIDAGISDGDLLVVDRALEPAKNSIVICVIDGEFTVKRISRKGKDFYLIPANAEYKPIKIEKEQSFQVWGVVAYVIHKV